MSNEKPEVRSQKKEERDHGFDFAPARISKSKTDKESAFLFDLYVAPDWGERFAALADEHLKPLKEGLKPLKEGRMLYLAAGTGGHALAMLEQAGKDTTLVGVDESEERLKLARAKASAMNVSERTEFYHAQLEELDFDNPRFDVVFGDASLIRPERLPEILAEMVRVANPGSTIALSAVTSSSFGEFFSVYWEALLSADLAEYAAAVERLITDLPTPSDLEALFAHEGLGERQSWISREDFTFSSGEEFLDSPLITIFLLQNWLEPLPDEAARQRVREEVARIIDEERNDAEFVLSVKATLVVGHKSAA